MRDGVALFNFKPIKFNLICFTDSFWRNKSKIQNLPKIVDFPSFKNSTKLDFFVKMWKIGKVNHG